MTKQGTCQGGADSRRRLRVFRERLRSTSDRKEKPLISLKIRAREARGRCAGFFGMRVPSRMAAGACDPQKRQGADTRPEAGRQLGSDRNGDARMGAQAPSEPL